MIEYKILVIHRRSTFEKIQAENAKHVIANLLAQKDPLTNNILLAHKTHCESVNIIKSVLKEKKLNVTWRHDFGGIIPDNFDLVITVGGDGTVLHTSHYISNTPVLAVNSSPETSTGYFAACDRDTFSKMLDSVIDQKAPTHKLYRMTVMINGEVVNSRVLNDVLFCNNCPATTTRYELSVNNQHEHQVSSGVWISTAAGSTAAISAAGGKPMKSDDKRIQYTVREPCKSGGNANLKLPDLSNAIINENDSFSIRSKSENASLYIDGPHLVANVNFGDIVTFRPAIEPFNLFKVKP